MAQETIYPRADSDVIREKLKDYYTCYYRDTLNLPDWEARTGRRLDEEQLMGSRTISLARRHGLIFDNKRVLVVGCGTGAEIFYLFRNHTPDVYGIEPFPEAFEICKIKAQREGLPADHLQQAPAECLPFPDAHFDHVVCFTVIEHVQKVTTAYAEINRVLRTNGTAFLVYPNYRYPKEQHYKLHTFPPALCPAITRLHLKAKRRYTPYFESLNFLTIPQTRRILRKLEIKDYEILDSDVGISARIDRVAQALGMQQDQVVLFRKTPAKAPRSSALQTF